MGDYWLQQFNPNANDLLDFLLPQIDGGMLRQIAAADYGHDSEEHLVPLKEFHLTRAVPVLDWHPREVLELIRWSEPDQRGWRPGDEGRRGHLLRAFACVILLRSYAAPENNDRWDSFNETAVQLADSIEALGNEAVKPAASFFAWCVGHLTPLDPDGIEGPFLGLALLRLLTDLPNQEDSTMIALCEWIDERVTALLREKQWWATRRRNWLLSTNHHNQRNDRWVALGRHLHGWADARPINDMTTWVALIGKSLAED
jgi:hypothetical protein